MQTYQHANMQTYHYGDIYCRFNSSFQGKAEQSFPFSKALLHGAVGYKVFPINTLAAKREEDLSRNGIAA